MKRLTGCILAAAIAMTAATPASAQMFLDRFSAECKKGALFGAAAGGVGGCLINKQLTQSDHDKLLKLEKKAAKAGVPKTAAWTNSSKSRVAATAFPGQVENGCRQVRVDLSVDGGPAQNFEGDRFCKSSNGSWTLAQS